MSQNKILRLVSNNILIIGLGSIARKHIQALRLIYKDVNIYALRSSTNALIEEGIINIYSKEEIPLNINFGIISSPTNRHLDALELLLEKRIPAFIEKPIYHKLDECYPYLKSISEVGLFNYVACNLRFLNSLKFLKNYIKNEKEKINEVNVYCGSYMPAWRGDENIKNYSAFESLGGGVHLDLFHEIDYCYWLFGQPITNRNILRSASTIHIDAIDYANINLIYENFTCHLTLNYYRKTPKRTIEVIFENHIIEVDLFSNSVSNNNGDILFKDSEQKVINTYYDQMKFFTEALALNQLPENNFQESLKILELCLTNNETF